MQWNIKQVTLEMQNLGVLRNILVLGKSIKFYGQFSYAAVIHCICGPLPYFGKNFPTT